MAPLKRKRGGQLGNTNALKAGFYSQRFTDPELADLNTVLGEGLVDEIALLRIVNRRVFNYANEHESQTFETWSDCANILGINSVRLATLLRTQALLGGDKGKLMDRIIMALSTAHDDLGFPNPRGAKN